MAESIEKEAIKQEIKPPRMWNVIFLNDDYTTFDFVIAILVKVFQKGMEDAERIATEIHQKGRGVVGQYTFDVASTKQAMALEYAKHFEQPLQVLLEQA